MTNCRTKKDRQGCEKKRINGRENLGGIKKRQHKERTTGAFNPATQQAME